MRISAFLLVGVLGISAVGCGDSKQQEPENKPVEGGEGKTDDTVVDLGGYEFTLASPFIKEEDSATTLGSESTLIKAMRQVEEAYNCKITLKSFWPSIENMRAKIMANDKIADIIHMPSNLLLQSIRAGYVQCMDDVKGIYPDDYRWVDECTSMASYDGKPYGLNFMRPSEVRTCLIYNRDILKESGVEEDLEQLVKDKQWTFDKFEEIAKKCTRDTNGDGTTDVWGLIPAIWKEFGIALINSNGGSLVTVEDGMARENFSAEENLTALNYLAKWLNEDKIIANVYGSESKYGWITQDYAKTFVNGECAFMFCESWLVTNYVKEAANEDLDYGMLPLPMGPDAEDYVSAAFNALTFAIPSTNTKDLDKTVIVLNALAKAVAGEEEGVDTAYDYDIMMDYFQKDDTKSVEMYKFVLSKSYVDLGSGIDSLYSDFTDRCVINACFRNIGTPASATEAMTGTFQSIIDSVYNNK